jgi:hypothetical protein
MVRESGSETFAAFPTGVDTLGLVFRERVDRGRVQRAVSYSTESGLRILEVLSEADNRPDPTFAGRTVVLKTEPMNGDAMILDRVRLHEPRPSGAAVAQSRQFLQGIASLPAVQWPVDETFPFRSRFEGILASGSCQKDGGVNSNHLIDQLGFSFIHVEKGGPFNSLKVVGQKHVPGIEEEVQRLRPQRLSPHVLWSGGEIQTVDGETRLVDTGFMGGSILPATPKHFPPPFRIRTADLDGASARTLRAKALQGVIVRFDNVTIDSVTGPNQHDAFVSAPHLRSFVFHDDSGARLQGLLLDSVTATVKAGQHLDTLRTLVHQPRPGYYEAIVELNEHLNYDAGFGNRLYPTGEGAKGYQLE